VTVAAGMALAFASAVALNWGYFAQHAAASSLPPLRLRHPIRALRALFAHRQWLAGFVVGLVGWVAYVAALALAPLSLVQATAAGGLGVLALLAHRSGSRVAGGHLAAVVLATVGLALLALSLGGGAAHGRATSALAIAVWLAASAALAVGAAAAGTMLAAGAGLGLAAGALYAAGDVGTKAVTFGGGWLVLVPAVLAAHGLAFIALQLGFQRGRALQTAGTSTLLTNALPIAAGIVLFHERLPGGVLGGVRVLAFACVVVAAGMLAREGPSPRHADDTLGDGRRLDAAQELGLVGAPGEADERDRCELRQAL